MCVCVSIKGSTACVHRSDPHTNCKWADPSVGLETFTLQMRDFPLRLRCSDSPRCLSLGRRSHIKKPAPARTCSLRPPRGESTEAVEGYRMRQSNSRHLDRVSPRYGGGGGCRWRSPNKQHNADCNQRGRFFALTCTHFMLVRGPVLITAVEYFHTVLWKQQGEFHLLGKQDHVHHRVFLSVSVIDVKGLAPDM